MDTKTYSGSYPVSNADPSKFVIVTVVREKEMFNVQ
jgi:hypothetical protein